MRLILVLHREIFHYSSTVSLGCRRLQTTAQPDEAFRKTLNHHLENDRTKFYQWGVERLNSKDTSLSFYNSDFSQMPHRFMFSKLNKPVLLFRDLFESGFNALGSYLYGDTLDQHTQGAIDALVKFILNKDTHENSLKKVLAAAQNDTDITSVLTQHLLVQLLPEPDNYLLEYRSQEKSNVCRCGCGKLMQFGLTSIGNKEFFYGYPDVVLFSSDKSVSYHPDGENSTPFVVQKIKASNKHQQIGPDLSYEALENEGVVVEEVQGCTFDNLTRTRLLKQAIAMSFCQRKYVSDRKHIEDDEDEIKQGSPKPLECEIATIPCCGITPLEYAVAMYDTINDVLLLTDSQRLFTGEETLNIPAIINLWMVINHTLFCGGLWEAAVEDCRGSSRMGLTKEEVKKIIQGSHWFFEIDRRANPKDDKNFEATEIILSKKGGRVRDKKERT